MAVGTMPNTPNEKKFDETHKETWSDDFKLIEIESSLDSTFQKAYFYKSSSNESKPLIVSLHTWSGDYTQADSLAKLCKLKDVNYIHPDFRGANWTKDACCSDLALDDIDNAITYAIENSNVDLSQIYVVGVSGGGYAALCTFMKSKHNIQKFSSWAAITDLIAWYNESKIRKEKYADDILKCTESSDKSLNQKIAKQKSPIFWETPIDKLSKSKVYIYVGIYDGIQGSVPITHSINFYNKLLTDLSVTDSSKYVSAEEKLQLLEYRKPIGNFGKISGRDICLIKEFKNIKIVVFKGSHEMLVDFALNELLEN